jgi:hypothetical protein
MQRPFITVVSGLPRSGTSMAMQMLVAGGVQALTDAVRAADDDNPRGYLEFERVKALREDKAWVSGAVGKCVKVIHLLLPELPSPFSYRVIFLRRSLDEVIRSQAKMLERSGRVGGGLPLDRLKAMYEAQLKSVDAWLAAQPNFSVLRVEHADFIRSPHEAASRVDAFLGSGLDVRAMSAAVDPTLHRNRGES